MPCFYCGKRISLVRHLTDADFCSEEHRRKYHDLTRMALVRLVESRQQMTAAAPQRRRPKAGVVVEEPPVPTPPVAAPVGDRVAAFAVTSHSCLYGEFARPHCAIRLPSSAAPVLVPFFSPGLLAVRQAPEAFSGRAAARIAEARGGKFVRPPLGWPALGRHFGAPAPAAVPCLASAPLSGLGISAAEDGKCDAPARMEVQPALSSPRLPRLRFAPAAAVPSPAGGFCGIPTALPREPAGAATTRFAEVQVHAQASAFTRTPAWQPRHAGFEKLVGAFAAPPAPGELMALPAPEARWPVYPGAAVLEAGFGVLALARPLRLETHPVRELPAAAFAAPARLAASSGVPHQPGEAELLRAAPVLVHDWTASAKPRTRWHEGRTLLGSGSVLPVEAPSAAAGAELRLAHLAPSPPVPIGKPLYIGWAGMRLRRVLGAAPPLPPEPAQARTGAPDLRVTPAPGFRIAAWAFTGAPGVPRAQGPAVARLLAAGEPGPADRVRLFARGLEQFLLSARPLFPACRGRLAAVESRLVAGAPSRLAEVSPALVGMPIRVAPPAAYLPRAVSWAALQTLAATRRPIAWSRLEEGPAAPRGPAMARGLLRVSRALECPIVPSIAEPVRLPGAGVRSLLRQVMTAGERSLFPPEQLSGKLPCARGTRQPQASLAGIREVAAVLPEPVGRVATAGRLGVGVAGKIELRVASGPAVPSIGGWEAPAQRADARGIQTRFPSLGVLVQPHVALPPTEARRPGALRLEPLRMPSAPPVADIRRSEPSLEVTGARRLPAPDLKNWTARLRPLPVGEAFTLGAGFPIRFSVPVRGHPQQAAGVRLEQAPVTMREAARLPAAQRPARPVLGAGTFVPAARSLALAAQGAAAGCARAWGWEAVGRTCAGFQAVGSAMPSVRWTSAAHRPMKVPEQLSGGTDLTREAVAALRVRPAARPRSGGIAQRAPFRWAPPAQPGQPATWDYEFSPSLRIETSVAAQPLSRMALPTGGLALGGACDLQEAPSAAREARAEDVRTALRTPPARPPALSGLAMPATRSGAGCVCDLHWPLPAPVEPAPRNRQHAPSKEPQEAPLAPRNLLEARPSSPVPHRFERLPVEPLFGPGFSLGRLRKSIPRFVGLPATILIAFLVLGFVFWNSGLASSLRDSVRQRAAVLLEEDFSSGLGRWTAGAQGWSRDPTGFVRVGAPALLGPSVRMTDYRLEFMGEIERHSLAWVFRAQDLQNYYVMKIAVLKAGPLPTMGLIRYEVIGGKEGQRVQAPLRVMLYNNAPFRVQLRVSGADFTTFINGQLVDFWGDDRLRAGGVGFFSEEGDRARLYWVKIAHRDDLLGKVCSFLAPYNLDSTNGSWK